MGQPRSLPNVTRPHRTCYSLLMLMTRILPYTADACLICVVVHIEWSDALCPLRPAIVPI